MNEFITSIVTTIGPLGVASVMFAAMVIPFIPSEFTIGSAGVVAADSSLSLLPTLGLAVIAVWLGNLVLYTVGAYFDRSKIVHKLDKLGALLGYRSEDIDKAERYFKNHGSSATAIGQLLPGLRFAVGLTAGMLRVSFKKYAVFVFLSGLLWV